MKRKHRRQIVVRPDADTHVHVDRSISGSSFDWAGLLVRIAIAVVGVWFALWLLAKLLPWLILGAAGWTLLKFSSRR